MNELVPWLHFGDLHLSEGRTRVWDPLFRQSRYLLIAQRRWQWP
jgi:hypothetical protein